MTNLKDTINLMCSENYKERFVAEYWQLKIRYEKLKTFCNKIEAVEIYNETLSCDKQHLRREEPKHDIPVHMLRSQQRTMGEYLHTLELRAVLENIDLDMYNKKFECEDASKASCNNTTLIGNVKTTRGINCD